MQDKMNVNVVLEKIVENISRLSEISTQMEQNFRHIFLP